MTSIASTEHGKPLNWTEKKMLCDEAGIKFMHGVEIYLTETHEEKVRDNYHTVLIARNLDGVRELNKLVSMSCEKDHFYYTNRISFDEFLAISDNIVSTSACLASPLNKLPRDHPRYMELARKYTFLEVQAHQDPDQIEYNKRILDLSREIGTPIIAGTDTHSLNAYKAECRSVLLMAKHKSYGNEDRFDLTFKSYDDLVCAFREQGAIPEEAFMQAIQNTNALSDMCEEWSLDKSIKYPILYGTAENDESIFEETVWDSLDEKIESGVIPHEQYDAFRSGLEEELRVFKKLKMCGFMLSMSELVRWCKSNGMSIGTARGSVGGSRSAYVTDIIDLNPEQWKTVFSRFANEDREEVGDIDTDVIKGDRPAIFEYITGRFGRDKTARVASYGTLAEKAVIEEIGRGLRDSDPDKYSIKAIDKIKKEYDADPDATKARHPDIFYYFDGLLGTKVSQSVHPAGMVISPITLDDNYGTFDKDGENCLMLDMECAHEIGLVKYDFLVLRNVEIIRDACRYAGIPYPRTCDMNFDDADVWKDMMRSQVGIFQFEEDFAFSLLKKFGTKSIFDMSLVTACIRPSGASYRNDLIAHKKHKNPSKIIDDLLADNEGYLVYQCDTIKFLQQICGLSGSEADNIRRAIGRKQRDRLEKAMPSILEGYCSKSDKPREEAEEEAKEFLQVIEDSASYQFGYNHSVAYCILGYYCAWMRYYYPIEFITSLLNNAANDDDINNGTKLAKLYGFTVENPKWGVSQGEYFYNKEKKTIAKGLASVKYIGGAVAKEIYDLSVSKKYESFMDVLYDLRHSTTVDVRQIDILTKIDFFSEFGNQRELLMIAEYFHKFKDGDAKQIKKAQVDGTHIGGIVAKYSDGKTKSGGEAASYKINDIMSMLRDIEKEILSVGLEDLPDLIKVENFKEIMGYAGYVSGKPGDRRKLSVLEVWPLKRKKDGKQFGYSIKTKSIGSGVESRFTVFNNVFNKSPLEAGNIIYCKEFVRDGAYFTLKSYERVI